jgi:hypothetical protein
MKALLLCLLLTGCQTVVYGPDGKRQFATGANAKNLTFTGPGTYLHADDLNHSTPTRAAGAVIGNAATGIGGIITSYGATNLLKP